MVEHKKDWHLFAVKTYIPDPDQFWHQVTLASGRAQRLVNRLDNKVRRGKRAELHQSHLRIWRDQYVESVLATTAEIIWLEQHVPKQLIGLRLWEVINPRSFSKIIYYQLLIKDPDLAMLFKLTFGGEGLSDK